MKIPFRCRPRGIRRTAMLALAVSSLSQAADTRLLVQMPAPMQEHMLVNMRDHLTAIGEIQAALAAGKFGQAADVAENRIGMSSLEAHSASHMAPYMPQNMQDIGTSMHRSASRFARTAQEAAVTRDLPKALGALADLTQQCTACHASYRIR